MAPRRKTHCPRGHLYERRPVRCGRRGVRLLPYCKTCNNAWHKAAYARPTKEGK